MVGLAVFEMEQGGCGEAVGEVFAPVEVHLRLQLAVLIGVRPHAVGALRLQKLYVYLSRGALISVLHARCALAHLYRLHPRAGHIAQTVRQGCATQVGNVLCEHLHVCAVQPKQLYLFRSGGSVAVAHIDGGIGGKRLAQVAAGGAYKLPLTYYLCIVHPYS